MTEILTPADEFLRLAAKYAEIAPVGNVKAMTDVMAAALAEILPPEQLNTLIEALERDLAALEAGHEEA